MQPQTWDRVKALMSQALAHATAGRREAARALAGNDIDVLNEVESLLAMHEDRAATLAPLPASFVQAGLLTTLPRLGAPEAEVAREGDRVGPYRLRRALGHGGMSTVWLAERATEPADEGVKRQVAVKLPRLTLSTPRQLEQFARERDVLAGLEHAHIARLYEAGVSPAGQPYLVLEYVDGVPLTRYCDEHRLAPTARLRLFLQVLSAVEHAHKHLVVHRDLKPANILVDAQGQVKLLDFGIAKLLRPPGQAGRQAQTTQQGGWPMTPLYAAPEQMQGQAVTTATDVYALGVVLYELLTGQWPYGTPGSQTPDSHPLPLLMHAVLTTAPVRPSAALPDEAAQHRGAAGAKRLRAELQGDLDTLVLKALRKLPEQRYASAERFADDVRRLLAHQPIAARPPSWWYSTRLFARRHRGASLVAGLGLTLASAMGGVAWQQHWEAVEHQERAATMRDFMFDLVNDAEPDESQPTGPMTAQQMLDGAVRRARERYGDMPGLQGELLSELGRMYGRLGEPETATRLQTEGLNLLQVHVKDGDPALNRTRASLASVLLEYGGQDQRAQAAGLAQAAADRCRGSSVECAKARTDAFGTLAYLHELQGSDDAALIARRRSAQEAVIGFGPKHDEAAQALHNLAIVARNAGQLQEARSTVDLLLATFQGRTLRAGTRIDVLILKALLEFDLGRYDSAQHQLLSLINDTAGAAGPALQDRWQSRLNNQLVSMHHILANVRLAQGNPAAARRAAETAAAMFRPEQRTADALYGRQIRAQASGLLGHPQDALGEVQAVIDGLHRAGQSLDAEPVLRVRRLHGEMLARAGRLLQARQELEAVAAAQAGLRQPHPVQSAQTLDQLGSVLRELGLPEQAEIRHEQARALLERALPADHPLLARNALYRTAAHRRSREHVMRQAERYLRLFPRDSVWRQIVGRHLSPDCPGPQGTRTGCLLLL
ncbi:MAG TPA: serine/threonine-protein kinase [Burkholderiaceae bacterium]|nr:serine/threonine-protein kinase [Burkholderiaceae bacterium]